MAAKRKPRKPAKPVEEEQAKLHPDLQGFNISLDPFGRVETNMNLDNVNSFLNRNLRDRKLDEKIDRDAGKIAPIEKPRKKKSNRRKKKSEE
jgi:hypothetical protein